jgi:signal transduction protein with GAF and PtsI domain
VQDSSDINLVLEEAIDALLAGNRAKYNRLIDAMIAEVRTVKTYKALRQCLGRHMQLQEEVQQQHTSTAAIEQSQEKMELLTREDSFYQQQLEDLKRNASRLRGTSVDKGHINTGQHQAATI